MPKIGRKIQRFRDRLGGEKRVSYVIKIHQDHPLMIPKRTDTEEFMHPYRNIGGAFLDDLGQCFFHGSEIVCCCSISLSTLLENLFAKREKNHGVRPLASHHFVKSDKGYTTAFYLGGWVVPVVDNPCSPEIALGVWQRCDWVSSTLHRRWRKLHAWRRTTGVCRRR